MQNGEHPPPAGGFRHPAENLVPHPLRTKRSGLGGWERGRGQDGHDRTRAACAPLPTASSRLNFQPAARSGHRRFSALLAIGFALLLAPPARADERWVTTWACAPQLVEPGNLPPVPLAGHTLRQFVRASLGGTRVRVRLANTFGQSPVEIRAARLALAPDAASAGPGVIWPATDRALQFGGAGAVTLAPGQTVVSDPLDFPLPPLGVVAISLHLGAISDTVITGHPGSRTTSFIVPGDAVSAAVLPEARTTRRWYLIHGLEVAADPAAAALVILGDSLTDGRGSTDDAHNRWPDVLAARFATNPPTARLAVVNQGIGGNALFGGLGPAALSRFDRDVLEQPGARDVLVFIGVNDLGAANASPATATNVIRAWTQLAQRARARGLRPFLATITPFGGSQYDSDPREELRQFVNAWARTNTLFDACVDFDAAIRDPDHPRRFRAEFHPGPNANDWLHLNPVGYRALAEAVDLKLFQP